MKHALVYPLYITNEELADGLRESLKSHALSGSFTTVGVYNHVTKPYAEIFEDSFHHLVVRNQNIIAGGWNDPRDCTG